jgi:CheY-like chemotaxis protein
MAWGVVTGAKILVVEDDPSLRTVIRLVLEQEGYEIAEASNGQVALDELDDHRPDLIIVDAKMPILTGPQLIERIREQPARARIPVILLTGLPGAVPQHVKADMVVAKPFEKKELVDVIGRLLASNR